MEYDHNSAESNEGTYEILQNAAGEILIMIKQRRGGPENPRFVYDGGDTALLYRSRESSVFLGNINLNDALFVQILELDLLSCYNNQNRGE